MTNPSIIQDAALAKKLKTIPVNKIELGMIVHAIAEQTGSLGVKNKGRVGHLGIIQQLSDNGVISVVVEPSPSSSKGFLDKLKAPRAFGRSRDKMRLKSSDIGVVSSEKKVPNQDSEVAFTEATKVLDKCHALQKEFSRSITKELSVDFSPVEDIVSGIYDSMIKHPSAMLCLSMLMSEDDYLAAHSVHCATLLCHFANYLHFSRADCERLTKVGYLFDIGMLKVPETIRSKKGRLTHEELCEVQKHLQYSLELLAKLDLDNESILAIEQHHERLDGSGYPHAYTSDKIHKFSRILAIVDAFDAMTATRLIKHNSTHKDESVTAPERAQKRQAALTPTAALKVLSQPQYGYDQKLVLDFIRCIGIYPVGSMLVLSNNHLALVMQTNKDAPLAPVVKVFYSICGSHFITPKIVNLNSELNQANKEKSLTVVKPVLASQYGLNVDEIL
jgi:HD-GYP domain-containing protein (c-di-GMP phosphodiesterase class II)